MYDPRNACLVSMQWADRWKERVETRDMWDIKWTSSAPTTHAHWVSHDVISLMSWWFTSPQSVMGRTMWHATELLFKHFRSNCSEDGLDCSMLVLGSCSNEVWWSNASSFWQSRSHMRMERWLGSEVLGFHMTSLISSSIRRQTKCGVHIWWADLRYATRATAHLASWGLCKISYVSTLNG